jgi:tRNA A-37 threonylcarbamoyl transferase component Bud32
MTHLKFNLNDNVPADWAREIWHQAVTRKGHSWYTTALPKDIGRGEAVVKRYFNKPKHKRLRRLLYGRAAWERKGLKLFQHSGIATVPLLFCAQQRRLGLVNKGIVATIRVPTPNIEEAYLADPDPGLLHGTACALALIHRAGFTHGDPRLRNFLNTKPHPQVLDLASWSRFNPRLQIKDLSRFLGRVIVYSRSDNLLPSLLNSYQSIGLTIPISTEELYQRAAKSAQKKLRQQGKSIADFGFRISD